MHAIQFSVTVRIKLGLDPKIVPDPILGLLEAWHNLGFTL